MSCRMPKCHLVRPNGSAIKLDHDKDTSPGATFYYCSIHHVYHCVAVKAHRRLPQPLCGECAWLFFKFPKEAAKHPESDITATAGPGNVSTVATESPFGRTGAYDPLFDFENSTATNTATTTTPLDRNKRPLLAMKEILDSLSERARNYRNMSQLNNWKRVHQDPEITNSGARAPSRIE
ncbi:hypothetical protein F5Y11DRAFT_343765 [Daldinia sp. FL1419]|nr:hypothetical protein F5Y11DRAFT_343765 [Daldinia sp. FL1419]